MLLEENSSVNETVNETSAIILEKPINVSESSSYSQESNASNNESHDLIDNKSSDLNNTESPSYSVNESNNTPENILEDTHHNISENEIGDIPQDLIQNMTDELDKLKEQPEKVKDDKEFDVIVKSSYMKG